MAKPRRIIPGATHFLTRRTGQRTFRLRPHPLTNQIALYCLAWAAARFGMLVHAVIFMSNHVHLVVTDPKGLLPDFLREFHRSMAKAVNAAQGQWENLWSAEHASAVALPVDDDVLAKIAYAVANPVAAALVEDPSQWPGVVLWEPGTSVLARRPPVYFDPRGTSPESVDFRIVAPPNVDDARWVQRVRTAVADAVKRARAEVRNQGLQFLGAAAVMTTSFLERAKSYEAKRTINPTVAARSVSVRKAYRQLLRVFWRAYSAALEAWKAGDRMVAFPFGTWWMRVHHGADALPAPAA